MRASAVDYPRKQPGSDKSPSNKDDTELVIIITRSQRESFPLSPVPAAVIHFALLTSMRNRPCNYARLCNPLCDKFTNVFYGESRIELRRTAKFSVRACSRVTNRVARTTLAR